ncbi:MAG: glycosyltransferase [candidate division Zixibacteria bacterium]|nr:glycosyltransferase [candidate division Zixibacteria bacterium]
MKKVLIVTYYFPPLGGAGVQRMLKFARYLPEFGWEPTILTVKPIRYPSNDQSLLAELPENVKVYRAGSLDPHRLLYLLGGNRERISSSDPASDRGKESTGKNFLKELLIPDFKIGWLPIAVRAGKKILKPKAFDLIFSSSPPLTSHLIGMRLARKFNLPLAIDFRDPWRIGNRRYLSGWHDNRHRKLKLELLKLANGIVAVNQPVQKEILDALPSARTKIISNGFDSEDFEGITPKQSDRFEIVYQGTFNRLHDPKPFLKAYAELVHENQEFAWRAHFTHVGMILDLNWKNLMAEFKLGQQAESKGYLPHKQALADTLNADLLLLTTSDSYNSKLVSTGKIYEYLAARKPILAIVSPDGAAAELIRECKAGTVVAPDDHEGIKKALLEYFLKFKSGRQQNLSEEADISKYERKNLTRELASFFNQLV